MQFTIKTSKSTTGLLMVFLLFSLVIINSCGQSNTKSCDSGEKSASGFWPESVNITGAIDSLGVAELSGLHWNPDLNRLYAISDDGNLFVLQFNAEKKAFTLIGSLHNLGCPEGVTQVDYKANEFYTIDETHYEIRRFTHNSDFSKHTMIHKWNLLTDCSGMVNTGNDGPEGIVFVPDKYLADVGFKSSETDEVYTSKKGMGGLIFIAHQKKGLIWVFDVNPDKDDDFAFVGKYKTGHDESCDLAFDRSTGLLYILHNTDGNSIEVTDMSSEQHKGKGRFIIKNEYPVPNPAGGNDNIEGFAITPKFADPKHVSVWFCRDINGKINNHKNLRERKDCLRWFMPIAAEGNQIKGWNK